MPTASINNRRFMRRSLVANPMGEFNRSSVVVVVWVRVDLAVAVDVAAILLCGGLWNEAQEWLAQKSLEQAMVLPKQLELDFSSSCLD